MKRILLAVALLSACRHGPPEPVDIEASDVCALCRMAISETRYAAEWIDSRGNVYKFDDIGCMARFTRGRRAQEAAAFVMDYDGAGWIPAAQAHYVRASQIQSPMASGVIALRERTAAGKYAGKYGAAVLRFEQAVEK